MINRPRVLFACLVALAFSATSSAVDISHVDRVSLHPTEPTELTFSGSELCDKSGAFARFWCNQRVTIEPVNPDDKNAGRNTFRLTPQRPLSGVVLLRAMDNHSITRPHLFSVESQPTRPLPPVGAEPVTIPAIIEGSTQSLGEHRIAVRLQKGQEVAFEMVGSRLGTGIDGLLVLLDDSGKELCFSDDHPVTMSDPFLRYTPTYDGTHYLLLRDIEYRGSLRFQLRMGSPSVGATCYPSAIGIGETRRLSIRPIDESAAQATVIARCLAPRAGLSFLAAENLLTPVYQTHLPVRAQSREQPLPIPSLVYGQLQGNGEADHASFVARAEDRITITNRVIGPMVPVVHLFREEQPIASHHWGSDPRGKIHVTIPEDGVYRLEIRDALGRGGDTFNYGLSIRGDLSPATLRLAPSKKRKKQRLDQPHRFSVGQGTPAHVLVRADRRGVTGPIAILALCDGQACKVIGEIPDEKNEAEISIELPEREVVPSALEIEISGRCLIGDSECQVPMDLSEHVQRDFSNPESLPAAVTSSLTVVLVPADQGKNQ